MTMSSSDISKKACKIAQKKYGKGLILFSHSEARKKGHDGKCKGYNVEIKGTSSSDPSKGLVFSDNEVESMKNPLWRLIRVTGIDTGREKVFFLTENELIRSPVVEKRHRFRVKVAGKDRPKPVKK